MFKFFLTILMICPKMIIKPFFCVLVTCFFLAAQMVVAENELKMLTYIFRHGARTPGIQFPNDPYSNYSYPEGLEQLTKHGKRSLYKTGQNERTKFEAFLKSVALPNIIAKSSSARRCQESALSLLSGLFPPSVDQRWSSERGLPELWQPIAVSSVEEFRDYLLETNSHCPKRDTHMATFPNLPSVKKFIASNEDFISNFTKFSGHNASDGKWGLITLVYDTLLCERDYFGETWKEPEWLKQLGPNAWEKLKAFMDMRIPAANDFPQEFFKLTAGPWIKELLETMNSAVKKKSENYVRIYGTHDFTIATILYSFGLYKVQPKVNSSLHLNQESALPLVNPHFGSGLRVELRVNSTTSEHFVTLYHLTGEDNVDSQLMSFQMSPIFAERCHHEKECSLQAFTDSLKNAYFEDIEKACQVRPE